jgi:hypothetical protein
MMTAFTTLGDLLGKVAHLDAGDVFELATWDASGERLGAMPADEEVRGLLAGEGDNARALANLIEITATAMGNARSLSGWHGDRVALLCELVGNTTVSPFRTVRSLCGWSHEDLAVMLGVTAWKARELCAPWWRGVRGVDQVTVLARLGEDLAQWLEAHERRRKVA